jgi:D-lactate dehydrogenase
MIAFYDTKPYDRTFFLAAEGSQRLPWQFHDFRLSSATVESAAGSTAVCVFVNDRLDASCLKDLARLGVRQVALRCAGFNQVDLVVARELGLQVVRVPAYSPYAVAEHTVALLLTLNRQIHRAYNRVREHNFTLAGLVGFDLHGRTAGLIGTGKIGRVTAKILCGFGMEVLAYDPYPDSAWAESLGVKYVEMEHLLRTSNIVSLHLPLTPESRHLINEKTLGWMQQGAYLVNTSRGKLVDTQALLVALKSGKLGGVALDVYEEEEGIFFEDYSGLVLQDDELSRLLTFSNVLVTSHQAFLTRDALSEIARVTVTNLIRFAQGEPPLPDTDVLASMA